MNPALRCIKILVRLWQKIPKTPCCRFYPTCSEYFLLSVTKKGLFRGTLAGIARISRCHPLSKTGVDLP